MKKPIRKLHEIKWNFIWYIAVICLLITMTAFLDLAPSSGQSLPDLIVFDVQGDAAADEITFTVKNIGSSTASSGFSIQYLCTIGSDIYTFYTTCPNTLEPGEQYIGTFNVGGAGFDLQCGDEIQICVDTDETEEYHNLVTESNESNNCLLKSCDCTSEPEAPESEVWCCANGQVELVLESVCEQRGGTMHPTEEAALIACGSEAPESEVWCCSNGQVELVLESVCEQRGGTMHPTEEAALIACGGEISEDIVRPNNDDKNESDSNTDIIGGPNTNGISIPLIIGIGCIIVILSVTGIGIYLSKRKNRT